MQMFHKAWRLMYKLTHGRAMCEPEGSFALLDVVLERNRKSAEMYPRWGLNRADRWTVIHRQRAIARLYI